MTNLRQPKNAEEIEARASEWIGRRELGSWNESDRLALEIWLSELLAHRVAFVRLEIGWRRTERLVALRPPMREPARDIAVQRGWTLLLRTVAAVAIVAAMGVAGTLYFSHDSEQIYATPVGGHQLIALADGSTVELNTDTVLHARGRSVELVKGEAYFRIKHDAAHPFVVRAGGHRVTDLGTAFIVRNDMNRIVVRLLQGSARIETNSNAAGQGTVLSPGDVAFASARTLSVRKATMQKLEDDLSWRRGVLIFDGTTLAAAAAEFNRYNREKLVIADPDCGPHDHRRNIPVEQRRPVWPRCGSCTWPASRNAWIRNRCHAPNQLISVKQGARGTAGRMEGEICDHPVTASFYLPALSAP